MPAKIVVIGGGTGTYTVLSGLKNYFDEISAVVSMIDSGGSAKKERDEWGLLPVSDVRKALLALSEEYGQEGLFRELLNYRFSEGIGVEGTTFGNLFLVALSNILGSQEKAIEELGRILKIKGRVIPVTLDKTNLVAEYEEGLTVVGEHEIDEPQHDGRLMVRRLYLLPQVQAYHQALKAIEVADIIVVGPGDLYTSLLPNVLVGGVSDALRKSVGKKIYVANLVNRYGQTYGFSLKTYLAKLEEYIGEHVFDFCLVNNTPLPEDILRHYALQENSHPPEDDLDDSICRVVRTDLLSRQIIESQKGDKLKRSLLRHDPDKLARSIVEIAGSKTLLS